VNVLVEGFADDSSERFRRGVLDDGSAWATRMGEEQVSGGVEEGTKVK